MHNTLPSHSNQRFVPWYQRAGPWIGIGTNPGVVVLGGGLAARLDGVTLIAALAVGMAGVTALAVAQGILGRRRRQALVAYAEHVFGTGWAAWLFGVFITFGMVGWFSFYVSLAGASLSNLLGMPGWIGPGMLAFFLAVTSRLGINRWNTLAWLTALFTLLTAFSVLTLTNPSIAWQTAPFDFSAFFTGVATLVGYAIVFATRAGDFTWDLQNDRDVVWVGLSLLIPAWFFLAIGVMLYLSVGHWNIADVLARTRSAALAHIFLITATIAPALSAMYSALLASRRLFPVSDTGRLLLIAVTGALLGAFRFDTYLLTFLDVLAAIIPPALALMLIAGFWPRWPPEQRPWRAWAWMAGALTGIILKARAHPAYMFGAMAMSVAVVLGSRYIPPKPAPSPTSRNERRKA